MYYQLGCPSHRITQHLKAWYRCCQLAVAKTSLTESFIISNKQITISKANLHLFSGHLNFKLIIFCFPVYLWSVNNFFFLIISQLYLHGSTLNVNSRFRYLSVGLKSSKSLRGFVSDLHLCPSFGYTL